MASMAMYAFRLSLALAGADSVITEIGKEYRLK